MAQIEGFRNVLWNQEHKLYSHRLHCIEKMFINDRFWGGGNGWDAASFNRRLKALPNKMKVEKKRISGYLKDLLDGCINFM